MPFQPFEGIGPVRLRPFAASRTKATPLVPLAGLGHRWPVVGALCTRGTPVSWQRLPRTVRQDPARPATAGVEGSPTPTGWLPQTENPAPTHTADLNPVTKMPGER